MLALSASTSTSTSNITGTSASVSARSASASTSASTGANTSASDAAGIGTSTLHSSVYKIREVAIAILHCPFHCCCPHAAPGPYFFLGRWGVGFADEAYKGLIRLLRALVDLMTSLRTL